MKTYTYYEAVPNTEAHRLLQEYLDKCSKNSDDVATLAQSLGSTDTDDLITSDGIVCGLRFNECPEGWTKCKGYYGYYFPKRLKTNMDVIKKFASMPIQCPTGASAAIFGEAKLYIYGLRGVRGVGIETICDKQSGAKRHFVYFVDDKHAELYKEKANWPKGLRKTKASTVLRLQEQEEGDR